MDQILPVIVMVPMVALLIGFCFSNEQERPIFWISNGCEAVFFKGPVLYHSNESEFSVNFLLDAYSLVYLLVATFLSGVIVLFSKYYIHREKGYKRFFNNVKFFYFGLVIVLLAGNLETLFVGWEILGATSFFLIGFYRERYLPVKNALKVISLYRVADIAILLGIWLCHHYFGHSVNFHEVNGLHNAQPHIMQERFYQFFIPGVFLLAAMVKSAQLPFSSWLPRAMEGPTTSSAIFYGSLSVHIGVFLLIRTAPFWEENLFFHWIIGGIGLATSAVATMTARVQSTIKTQIAYSSIAQIGLMFMEVALGLYWLALIHFACNAFLRSYQLLVSPSVLSYRIHDQFFHFTPPAKVATDGFWNKLKMTVYVLSIKEFNLDSFMYRFLWQPLKRAGKLFDFLDIKKTYILGLPLFLMGLYAVYHQEFLPDAMLHFLPETFAILGVVFILKAFVERSSALNSWVLVVVNQLYLSLAFGFNEEFDFNQVHLYLSGIFITALIGIWAINKLSRAGEDVSLHHFHGHAYEYPRVAFVFVMACLGLAGFPITPTFIGEDLMLGHIHENQFLLLVIVVLNLILDGLVIFRIYSRLFLGLHKKGYHEVAYRSS
jgi:NADH-quinone oxidoreductase subunit L